MERRVREVGSFLGFLLEEVSDFHEGRIVVVPYPSAVACGEFVVSEDRANSPRVQVELFGEVFENDSHARLPFGYESCKREVLA